MIFTFATCRQQIALEGLELLAGKLGAIALAVIENQEKDKPLGYSYISICYTMLLTVLKITLIV